MNSLRLKFEPGGHPEKCPPHCFDPLQESGSGRVCSRCGEQEPRRPAEPEASTRGIEVSATLAQQAWYHVGQLAITHPQMFVGEAVREVYRLCGTEPGRCQLQNAPVCTSCPRCACGHENRNASP